VLNGYRIGKLFFCWNLRDIIEYLVAERILELVAWEGDFPQFVFGLFRPPADKLITKAPD